LADAKKFAAAVRPCGAFRTGHQSQLSFAPDPKGRKRDCAPRTFARKPRGA
jgi:hypothetical protein